MSMMIWWSVLETEKLNVYHASCDIIWICCKNETMSFIFLISEKFQIIVASLLNNIFSSKFFSCKVKASLHIILFARFKVNLNSWTILKNLRNSQWLYFSDFISVIFNLIWVSKICFQFVKSSNIESFDSDEFTENFLSFSLVCCHYFDMIYFLMLTNWTQIKSSCHLHRKSVRTTS